jgi:hypothetical protein
MEARVERWLVVLEERDEVIGNVYRLKLKEARQVAKDPPGKESEKEASPVRYLQKQ